MSTPDLFEEVIGYRAWIATHGVLRSLNQPYTWVRQGDTEAHRVPCANNWAGLYVCKSPRIAARKVGKGTFIVRGAIVARGRIVVCRDGFRAQFARPVAIMSAGATPQQMQALSDAYGIEIVHTRRGLKKVARRFGQELDKSLYKHAERDL